MIKVQVKLTIRLNILNKANRDKVNSRSNKIIDYRATYVYVVSIIYDKTTHTPIDNNCSSGHYVKATIKWSIIKAVLHISVSIDVHSCGILLVFHYRRLWLS